MNLIRRKLNSQRGASILMALLLFLVCLFAGGGALAAAYNGVVRNLPVSDEQQNYLAVASAVELLQQELLDQTVTVQHVEQTIRIYDHTGAEIETGSESDWYEVSKPYTGSIKQIEKDALEMFKSNGVVDIEHELSLSLDGYPQLSGVKGKLVMKTDPMYSLSVELTDEEGLHKTYLTVTAVPNTGMPSTNTEVSSSGEGVSYRRVETTTKKTATAISWDWVNMRVTKDGTLVTPGAIS